MTLGTITSTLSSQLSLKNGGSSATATISASDPITVNISGPTSVDEGDATTAYTVSLSPSGVTPTSDLTVSYGTSNGTATAGMDYTAKSGTLTFTNSAAGSQTFTVQTTEDAVDEGTGETFKVTISSPSGGGGPAPKLSASPTVTTTITDDDNAPTGITLSASPNTLGEDDAATSVTVTATLSGGTTRTSETVVTIGTLAGTATKDTDYTATSLASITIPANSTSGTGSLTITPTDDSVVEGDETISIPGTTTVGLSVTSATVTLTDDDKTTTTVPGDKDTAELSITGPASNVSEGSNAVFTVTLSAAIAKEVQVGWSAPLSTDAAEGADLGSTSGTVTFAANSAAGATQSITITATNDKLSEGAEDFTVTLGTITSTLSSQVSLKNGAKAATATIAVSDPITISISGPTSVDEGDATTAYTVSLSPTGVTPTADLTVSYATSNGTAESGKDYTAKSGTLTFTKTAAGSQSFTVQTTEDTLDEGTGETFTVAISSPAGGGGPTPSLGTAKSVITTITDDDAAPTGITLSANPSTLGEDDSATSITVKATLNGDSTRTSATVVTIGTLAGTATKDTDYTASSLATITIPANTKSATGTITITPTDDSVVEGDETITVPGSTSISGLSVSDAIITLTDDDKSTTTDTDDKDSAEVSISGPASNVSEGSDATFTVTLSEAVDAQVTVAWSAPLSTDSAEGADLSATSGTVTFAANSAAGATQSITITATDDMLSETAESFTVTLGAITSTLSSQVSLKNGAKAATATISASDPITVNISGPSSVDEGDATSNYTVSLSPSGVTPTADLTVSYGTSNGTAESGKDYTAKSGTLTFTQTAAGSQTFTVQTTEDSLDEGTGETFTVAISSPSGGGGAAPSLGTSKSVTTTITDDDDAPSGITLSANPSSLGEDDAATSITVTATLNGDSTRTSPTVVTIGTLAGTATKDTDYTVTSLASITIPANSKTGTGTLTITPTDDSVVEGDETITIPGTTTTQVGLTVASASITLTDDNKTTTTPTDDKDSAELSISGPASNVSEGGNAVFTVTLSSAVAKEVQVGWSAPLGTDAAEAADLGTTSGTVTFAANSAAGATQSITIAATDDKLSETAEGFTVTLGTITTTLPSSQVSLKSGSSSATATIAESDPITINISGPTSVDEGDATGSYTVSLSPSGVTPTSDLTVSYATSNGTATAGTDYTAKSGTLTFTRTAAGSQTFTVQTTEDTIDEGTGETFTVTISSPSGGGGAAPSLATSKSVTTTITDDDDAPTGITLSASPNSLGEDDSATLVTVTATLDGSKLPTDTVVTIGTITGTATKGTDYTATTLGNITISANSSSGSQTFTVTPTDDAVVEGDETITIPGTTTVSGLSVSDAIVTLTDDDKSTTSDPNDKDSAELSISGPTSNVSEGGNAVFTVTLSQAVDAEVQVAWSAPLAADAADATDLGTTSGTVTFSANSATGATQTITIAATDDALSETAESFTVTLGTITSTLSSQVSLKSGASSDTATIAASDPITINISGPSAVDEGDATTAYTVSLSPSGVTPTSNLTVSYATSNGTATAGTDYTAKSGTLTFTQTAAGDQTFTVQTTEDDIDEGTGETFTVTISSPSGGGGAAPSLGTSKSVTTTITDDDDAPTGITLSASPNTLGEDDAATSITVTATLNGDSTRTSATVVTIGTITGTATKGTDYTATTLGNITISANSSSGSQTFTVTPTDDAVVEGDETIIIPGSTSTEVGLTVSSATVTLTDDNKTTTTPTDDKDSAELSITGPTSNVDEGSDAVFTVTLSKAVAKAVTVAWSAPLAADAAEGADLSVTSGTVTFAANSAAGSTQSITITTTDDNLSETAEGFTVTLGTITSTLSSQVSLKSGASSAAATITASDPITVNISGPSTVDEGDDATYTVSLSPSGVTPTADLTVSYATVDGTATAGSDYTAKSGTLTFTNTAAGDQTFTVQTSEDIRAESSETFTVTISSPTGGGGQTPTLGTSSVTTTISSNDPTSDPPDNNRPGSFGDVNIWLTVNPDSVDEDNGVTSFTVTATHDSGTPPTTDTTISLTLAGTADDSDYTAPAQASVTIPGGQNSGSGTLTLTLIDDDIAEGDETIIVGGSPATLKIASALITINDDDSTYLSISGPTADVQEGANASFTVTLSQTVTADVTVAWSATTDTAAAADLGTTSGSVTFPANSVAGATQTITVAVTDDNLSEGSETFSVSLGADTGNKADEVWVKSTAASATATIAASDPITILISGPSSVNEGDTTTAYTVSLSPAGVTPTADLTVSYATSNGTATAGSDYTSTSGTLTFTATDAGSKTFTVETTEDTVDEPGETFTVAISSPSGGGGPAPSLGTSKSVTTTITDDDDAPSRIDLSVSPSSVREDEDATSFTVTATLQGGTTLPTDTVITIGTLGGGATKDTDYEVDTALASITISANSDTGTGTLTIDPTDDSVVEGDETITIPGTTTVSGLNVTPATITLTDHNTSQQLDTAKLSISGPVSNVAEGGNASFTVTLSKAVAKEMTVAWSAPLSADTAKAADLGSTSGTVTFAANSAAGATQTITVAVTDDSLSETSESFTVTLGAVGGDLASQVSVDSSAGSATATISESDPITVSISGPTSVDEGDATGNYTVSLSGGTPTADLTVTYATSAGTATAGTDYTSASGTLTFTATNAADKTFTVQTTEDTVDETDETFTVTISSPAGGGGPAPSLGTSKSVTTTINDDDNAPSDISLSVNPSSMDEDGAAQTFTVTATLNGGTTRSTDTVVTISLGGTATKDTDYTVTTALASVTIPDSSTSGTGTLVIDPTNDEVVEGDETITVSGTTTVNLDVSSTEITITEDDSAELSIAGPSSDVAEGANAVFTVTLSKAVAKEVTVAWSTTAGTASSSDYTAGSGTVSFAANSAAGATQTITVAVADDDLSETSETFSVGLGTIGGDIADEVSLKTGGSSATATIAASDPITVSISGPSSVDEGEAATYTVSLSPSGVKPSADLTVNYATSDGIAEAGSDYTAASGTLTFTEASPGEKTFSVQVTEDTVDEADETFTVTISSPSGGGGQTPSLGTPSVSTTITGDGGGGGGPIEPRPTPPGSPPTTPPVAPTAITLSVNPNSVAEDAGATTVTVTATLQGGATHSEDVTVTLALSGTAGGFDYTASSLPGITIQAGRSSGSGTLTITPVDDGIIESPETIIVTGSATGLNGDSDTITLTDATDNSGHVVKAYLSIRSPSAETQEGSNAGFTVTLSEQVDADVTVAWNVIPGTAEAADVSATSGTVTFAANSAAGATQTVNVPVADDNLSELAEAFTVTLGTVTGDLASRVLVDPDDSSATATIAESDPITISISGPSTVAEGDATTAYTVSLSPSGVTPTADLTVTYATSDGTATAGSDYTSKSGTLTFTRADAGARTFTVQTTEDSVAEGTGETFSVAISNPVGGGGPSPVLGTSSVTTTITEGTPGDTPPPIIVPPPDEPTPIVMTLSVSPSSIAEDAGPTAVTVTATLKDGATRSEDTIVSLILSGTAGKSDYTASSLASITIPAGQSSKSGSLTITPTEDGVVEDPESIIITGTSTGLDNATDTITLTDASDDDGDVVKAYLSIESPPAETPEGANARFTVTLSRPVDADVTVAWSVIPGTADAADVGATTGTVTFAANSAAGATQTIEVGVTDDNLSEVAETFTVTLGTVSGDLASQVLLDPDDSSAPATISESDPITVSISGPEFVDEGDATAVYTVSLSPSGVTPTTDLTVFYSTADGTATEGSDYTSASGTLTFTRADAGPRTFMVQTTEDTEDEGTGETFSVFITVASTRADAGDRTFTVQTRDDTQDERKGDANPKAGGPSPNVGTSSATTTIVDDDAPGNTPIDAPPPDSEPPGVVTQPTPTPTSVATTTPGPGTTPTPTPVPTTTGGHGVTPTPQPKKPASSTPDPASGTTPTPTPTALPLPTPTPGTTSTLASGAASAPGATPTPSTLPPGSTSSVASDTKRTLTLGKTTTITSSTSSTPVSGTTTTITMLRASTTTPEKASTHGEETVVVMSQSAVGSSGGTAPTPTPAASAAQPATANPLSWLSPTPWFLLLLAVLIALAIEAIRRRRRRARPLGV